MVADVEMPFSIELLDGLLDELLEAALELGRIQRLQRVTLGGDELMLEIGGEKARCGDDPRVRRHQHAGD